MNIFKPRLRLVKGTRFVSFLFIGCSILIAAGILIAANMYYNIDTGEIVMSEIQRMTGVLRATAGVIVGGGPTQDPTAGYDFEVIGQSRLATTTFATGTVELIAANQLLKFTGGTGDYVGFKAPSLSTTSEYTWPATYPSTTTQILVSSDAGAMSWISLGQAGVGGVTAVGDCLGGNCFTVDGTEGTSLWFYDADGRGELTIADLSATRTYTLPNLSGTIALQAESNLSVSGGIVLADSLGRLIQDSNFIYATTTRTLSLGTASAANGIIRLYGSGNGYTEFQAANAGGNLSYTWPSDYGSSTWVLTTNGAGQLQWLSASGTGAITGSGAASQVTFWTSDSVISGASTFTWDNVNAKLTVGNGLITPLIQASNTLTLQSLNGNIVLYPSTGIVQLGTSTYIETASGYEIGRAGTEVLREMIPIMGFDLPVRTATSGTVQISRTIDNYPVSSCTDGTSRLHKLVIRYGSAGTTTWQVATSSTGYTSFDLPPTNSTTTGTVHTATTSIPTPAGACTGWIQNSATDDWWVRVNPGGNDTMIYQIFLAAYDQIQ